MSATKEFVISDESRNSYGFSILTRGINLEKFKRNPVMFYNHNREGGVIGRWENIRIENNRLLATPVFDQADELGNKIARKVETGFIRAASVGIEILQFDAAGEIALSTEVIECSVCDIPSNGNALMLYHKGSQVKDKETFINLNLIKNQHPMKPEDLKKILDLLGLSPESTIDDILSAIENIMEESPRAVVDNAIAENYVKLFERKSLLQMATTDFVSFRKYLSDRKADYVKEKRIEALQMINDAIKDGRIGLAGSWTKVKDYWLRAFDRDFEGSKAIIESLNKRTIYSELIKNTKASPEDRTGWGLSDYRKKAPAELQNNPELYQRLIDEEKEKLSKTNK